MTLDIENTDFCAYNSTLPITDVAIADNFEDAFNMLGPDHSFAFFDLGLTTHETETLNQLDATSIKRYEQKFNSLFHDSYMNYLEDIGNDKKLSSSTSSILEKIINSTQTLFPISQGITSVSRSSENLDVPIRWHTDTAFTDTEVSYRIVIALKGQGTMFCKFDQEQERVETLNAMNTIKELRNIINPDFPSNIITPDILSNAINTLMLIDTNILYKSVNPCLIENGATTHQVPLYFGAVFMFGNTQNPAIHTAPIQNETRIVFVLDLNI